MADDVTLVDLVKITANTTGTGAITLGTAVPGYRGVEALLNGAVYSYSIQQEAEYEVGTGTYLTDTRQFVRSPTVTSDGGTAINLQPNATVAFVATAQDILGRDVLRPIYGYGEPLNATGVVGQVYFDLNEPVTLYGPKTSAGWVVAAVLSGNEGKTGPADNTYTTYAALLASDPTRKSARLVPQAGETEPAGNFSYIAGQWVRQRADGIAVVRPAGITNIEAILRERVTTSGIGSDTAALQAAIDSGAREVIINNEITIEAPVKLRSGQTVRNAGGKLVVPANAQAAFGFPNAVLFNDAGATDITLSGLVIDASALTTGAPGIFLTAATGVTIDNIRLTKCNLLLEGNDNNTPRRTTVVGINVDMRGYGGSALYLSNIRDVSVKGGTLANGRNGVGIYNNARAIRVDSLVSTGHTEDGFLVNAGQRVSFTDCIGDDNGQSGFCTQRQSSGQDTRNVTFTACKADNNAYDGFDIRGANDNRPPWGVDTGFKLASCQASGNTGCGLFIVRAEGTNFTDFYGTGNKQQNIAINTSDRVDGSGVRSTSGAMAVPSGSDKAGVLIDNSTGVQLRGVVSGNWEGVSQEYGVTVSSSCVGCQVDGGDLRNNAIFAFSVALGNSIKNVNGGDQFGGVGVRFRERTAGGLFVEEGTGRPELKSGYLRPYGSEYTDYTAIGAEKSIANGVGSPPWFRVAITAPPA